MRIVEGRVEAEDDDDDDDDDVVEEEEEDEEERFGLEVTPASRAWRASARPKLG